MVRLAFFLAAPALAARVEVHTSSKLSAFAHLSDHDAAGAVVALEILEQLKDDASNVELQEKYREVIGDIDWEEDRAFLANGLSSTQAPVMLGQPSQLGTTLNLMELLTGSVVGRELTARIGRLFTSRRDFAIEQEGGQTKYMIDGITASLHSRMQISFPNEGQPRFVVRRAFNYLNPVATSIGQYVYRVIRCEPDSEGGWAGACTEGEILYTITKDRLGRGTLWGQDEYRVYTGTGGCRRWGHGVLSCSHESQIMYSLSAGLSSGTHDTNFYEGKISALDSSFETGRLSTGEELDASAIEGMKVATVGKFEGSPRALNWPMWAAGATRSAYLNRGFSHLSEIADSLSPAQSVILMEESTRSLAERWAEISSLASPAQEALFASSSVAFQAASTANSILYALAWAYHLAKSLIWADSYHVMFNGNPTDELLVSVVAAVQDLTREQVALRPGGGHVYGTSR